MDHDIRNPEILEEELGVISDNGDNDLLSDDSGYNSYVYGQNDVEAYMVLGRIVRPGGHVELASTKMSWQEFESYVTHNILSCHETGERNIVVSRSLLVEHEHCEIWYHSLHQLQKRVMDLIPLSREPVVDGMPQYAYVTKALVQIHLADVQDQNFKYIIVRVNHRRIKVILLS